MPIKESQIRTAAPRDMPYKLADSEGLFLLVKPNGSKLWRMKYRFSGKEGLLSFGAYPTVSLTAARELRLKAKHTLALGQHSRERLVSPSSDEDKHFARIATRWH